LAGRIWLEGRSLETPALGRYFVPYFQMLVLIDYELV